MNVLYHPGKANVVVDSLSFMCMGSVPHVEEDKKDLVKDVHRLAHLGVKFEDCSNGGFIVYHNSELPLVVEVKSKQHLVPSLMELKEFIICNLNELFSLRGGVLMYQERLCVPNVDDLRNQILEEAHGSHY